jgi:hypothetical protein
MFAISEAADANYLVQGGQLYWALPFSKGSLPTTFPTWLLHRSPHSATAPSLMALSITTLSLLIHNIGGLHVTLSISDSQHNNALPLCWVSFILSVGVLFTFFAECHYGECHYAKCRSAFHISCIFCSVA